MSNQKTSLLSNGLLWFGAAISIAEILTGALLAPLGLVKGMTAIIVGHIIGCALLYLAGLIGAQKEVTAMESVRIAFGANGSKIFSLLNVMQLVGWTAVMIIGGARAISIIANPSLGLENHLVWCGIIGALILLWIIIGIKNIGKINIFAVGALFALTIILSSVVFKGPAAFAHGGSMSFGMAVELSAAMPLSWLPLISDYTKNAKKPLAANLISTIAYFIGSCWMYIIGLGAAIFAGNSDIAQIMVGAGLGLAGAIIVLLSTVTTTFLDVYSAGVSFNNISPRVKQRCIAISACIAGTLIAMFTPIEQYQNFLYLIGSVFAPMVSILITDYFILKKDSSQQKFNSANLILWAVGFIIYRVFIYWDTPIGSTLPVMVIVSILVIIANKLFGLNK